MKKIILKLLRVLMLIAFCIGLIIVIGSTSRLGFRSFWIFLTGLLMLAPFSIYLYFATNRFTNKDIEDVERIQTLKQNGIKLHVNLEVLELSKTRKSYYSKVIHNSARSGALNQLMGNPDKNIQTTTYINNEIKFKVPYGNNFIKFTKTINMEPTTLMLHFAVKKETNLYVNPTNMSDYYLDLEFLNQ